MPKENWLKNKGGWTNILWCSLYFIFICRVWHCFQVACTLLFSFPKISIFCSSFYCTPRTSLHLVFECHSVFVLCLKVWLLYLLMPRNLSINFFPLEILFLCHTELMSFNSLTWKKEPTVGWSGTNRKWE